MTSNFSFVEKHNPLLLQLARTAEQAVPDPNITLIKVRQLGEAIAQDIASRLGVGFDGDTSQNDLLRTIKYEVELSREILDAFHVIRKEGSTAVHEFVTKHREAGKCLKLVWLLSVWYHRTFGNPAKNWKAGVNPSALLLDAQACILELTWENQRLRAQLPSSKVRHLSDRNNLS